MEIFNTIALLLVVSLIGCDPECELPEGMAEECIAAKAPIYLPGDMTYGRVAGLKNCLPFVASATAYVGENDSHLVGLVIETFESLGGALANKETLMIGSEGYGKGIWPLLKDTPNEHFQSYSTVKDHDVFEDLFYIDSTYQTNRIIITHIDSLNKIIQGSFDARFLLVSSIPSGKNPDTVIFSQCNFIARQP